jgi:hypothetical protein
VTPGELPYIDEHALRVAAPRAAVWTALERYVAGWMRQAEGHPLTRVLGTDPPTGFAVAEREPTTRLVLAGRHRFARYELAFELADARGGTTQLRAQTYALFPGPHGRLYRALVIGTRGHVLVTNHLLRAIARLSERPAAV